MTPRTYSAERLFHLLRRAGRVVWSLRMLGLFLLGPGVGLLLVGMIFGLPTNLRWLAAGTFAISVALFGMLATNEWRGLTSDRRGTRDR